MIYESNALQHFGIKGQKWGLRRFQQADGSLTAEGRERYGVGEAEDRKKQKQENKERYQRGKALSKERDSIAAERRQKILDKDDRYKDLKEQQDLEERRYANARNAWEKESYAYNIGRLEAASDEHFRKADAKAMKHANKVMTEKYGDKVLSDIDHYKKESEKKFNRFVGGALAAFTVAAIGAQIALNKKGRSL